jgi:RNA polymerase sigma-70 factor (ECF subfamily)
LTPEKIFEQRWAQALLDLVIGRLCQDYAAQGKAALFEQISASLSRSPGAVPYAQIAARLGTTEAAVKMAVHRLRARYRDLLREEIAQTVSDPRDIEGELRALFAAFST